MKIRPYWIILKHCIIIAICIYLSACGDNTILGSGDNTILVIRPANPTLVRSLSVQLTAITVKNEVETNVTDGITWKSSDTIIAIIDSHGKATAQREGVTTITATYKNKLTQTTRLGVVAPGCIYDLSDWKLRYKPNSKCLSCHTDCGYCHAPKSTNCEKCHSIPHKLN